MILIKCGETRSFDHHWLLDDWFFLDVDVVKDDGVVGCGWHAAVEILLRREEVCEYVYVAS